MKLYEINEEIERAVEALERGLEWEPDTDADGNPIDSEGNVIDDVERVRAETAASWTYLLEELELAFEDKAENLAAYIKCLKSESEAIYKEECALKKRRAVKENALKRVAEYLLGEMERAGVRKIDTAKAQMYIRNNAESVEISDERRLIDWAKENAENVLKYREPEIRKRELLAMIKAGNNVPAARIVRTQSVIIK